MSVCSMISVVVVDINVPQTYLFKKAVIHDGEDEAQALCEKLLKFGVSLVQYKDSLVKEDITM